MGMYALAGLETDERLRSKIYDYVLKDINRRREYAKNLTQGSAMTCMFEVFVYINYSYYKITFIVVRFN